MKKVWLVEHPTTQYKENVLQLAASKGLEVIDAIHQHSFAHDQIASDTPKLTKKSDKKAK
jgi:hypothetical protein